MAVDGNDGAVHVGDVGLQVGDQAVEFIRHRVPHRIRDVDDGGSRVNDGFHHLRQKIGFRAGGVLRGKLHFPAQPRGQGDAP